jgi:hypothetical protein
MLFMMISYSLSSRPVHSIDGVCEPAVHKSLKKSPLSFEVAPPGGNDPPRAFATSSHSHRLSRDSAAFPAARIFRGSVANHDGTINP